MKVRLIKLRNYEYDQPLGYSIGIVEINKMVKFENNSSITMNSSKFYSPNSHHEILFLDVINLGVTLDDLKKA